MCGLFGIYYRDPARVIDEDRLRSSAGLLHHRGPDAEGVYAGTGMGLAHTRLSLVDLNPRSNQPFWDDTGRYVLVFNGEIYNFRELRSELQARGVCFHTTSDTEVLLHSLILDEPSQVLPRLGGMFAFAFYDTREDHLLLARDRFGMKPLYLYDDGAALAFASEVKALRPWVQLEHDPFSISSYLLGFGGPTKGFTFYKHVKSVGPGEYVSVRRRQQPSVERFFSMPDFWDRDEIETLDRLKPKAMVDRMEALMWDSVKRHMFADSAVGAFCSGGVDSSLIMAMAAKQHNNLAIFHANVVGPWSEVGAARQLAKHLKLDLKSIDVHEQDFIDHMPDVMRQYEHPFTYHPNCAPFMMVSRLVREHGVKGMLSGEGSDELFLGYPWLGRERMVNAYYALGGRVRGLVNAIPAVGKIIWPHEGSGKQVVRDLMNRCEVSQDERHAREVRQAVAPGQITHENLRTVDYLNYHLRTLLHRNDCLGMEASIEARFPFLDHDVARTAVNMPSRYKLRFSPTVLEKAHPMVRDKWVVRKVADRWIPKELSQRIKIGFWTTAFQRTQVAPAYFQQSFVRDLFELSSPQVSAILEAADQDLLMRLLHLDVWAHVCLHDLPRAQSVQKLRDHVTIRPE
ncbi:MAG TPA: asparagine synthase (glutamine-hydrolyzing) [Polyangiales bacterium]